MTTELSIKIVLQQTTQSPQTDLLRARSPTMAALSLSSLLFPKYKLEERDFVAGVVVVVPMLVVSVISLLRRPPPETSVSPVLWLE